MVQSNGDPTIHGNRERIIALETRQSDIKDDIAEIKALQREQGKTLARIDSDLKRYVSIAGAVILIAQIALQVWSPFS